MIQHELGFEVKSIGAGAFGPLLFNQSANVASRNKKKMDQRGLPEGERITEAETMQSFDPRHLLNNCTGIDTA